MFGNGDGRGSSTKRW